MEKKSDPSFFFFYTLYVIQPRNVLPSLHSTAWSCYNPDNTRKATQRLTLQTADRFNTMYSKTETDNKIQAQSFGPVTHRPTEFVCSLLVKAVAGACVFLKGHWLLPRLFHLEGRTACSPGKYITTQMTQTLLTGAALRREDSHPVTLCVVSSRCCIQGEAVIHFLK